VTLWYMLKMSVFPSVAATALATTKVEIDRAFQAVAPEHTPWTD